MTEDFMKIVQNERDNWIIAKENASKKYNLKLKQEIDNYNIIHELMDDKKVKEFAKLINYKNMPIVRTYLPEKYTLYDYLSCEMSKMEWTGYELSRDKYPIFCYLKTIDDVQVLLDGNKISNQLDIYYNLQQKGFEYIKPSNIKLCDVIYAPDGKSFMDDETFYSIQTEYVQTALESNQNEAKKLILSKYNKK